jgi:uncharacterized membrane protein YecN with MAPEG domain
MPGEESQEISQLRVPPPMGQTVEYRWGLDGFDGLRPGIRQRSRTAGDRRISRPGMVALFAFEFIEGNTITRLYFMRLRRLTREAVDLGHVTPALAEARREQVPAFTHFLDIPILFLIVILGAMRPNTWTLFITGTVLALAAAALLTLVIPRLYPFVLGAGAPVTRDVA